MSFSHVITMTDEAAAAARETRDRLYNRYAYIEDADASEIAVALIDLYDLILPEKPE